MKVFMAFIAVALAGCVGQSHISSKPVRMENPPASLAASAKTVFDGLEDRRNNGETLTPAFLETEYIWSRRQARTEYDIAGDDAGRLSALEGHLYRMKKILASIFNVLDGNYPAWFHAQLDYYTSEAQYFVDQAKSKT